MDFTLEKAQGWPSARIFGVDEAGRGSWAGSVSSAKTPRHSGSAPSGDSCTLKDSGDPLAAVRAME